MLLTQPPRQATVSLSLDVRQKKPNMAPERVFRTLDRILGLAGGVLAGLIALAILWYMVGIPFSSGTSLHRAAYWITGSVFGLYIGWRWPGVFSGVLDWFVEIVSAIVDAIKSAIK